MNIVFFGTSEFAIPSLRALLVSRHKVLALVTQPDRKKGRSLKLSPPPAKVIGRENNIPVYQPQDASSRESVEYLKKLGADLFVVISFGQILKKEVLSVPSLYSINLHGSLLPKYRGAAPTNWAVINGDKSSGVTIIKMNERMDEGDIIAKKEVAIEPVDTNITLGEKLSDAGAALLVEILELIESGKASFTKQDGSAATYAPKLKKADGLIDWSEPALKIHDRVRGLLPWPGAYTYYDGKILKLLQTKLPDKAVTEKASPGEVLYIGKEGIAVRTGTGDLIIEYLQLEGKKDMDAASFIRGHKLEQGYIFGK
jgi:methionyl-tRNA formyltransferase